MDQSFSPANLRRIWDAQTRKGRDLLGFFPEVKDAYESLRETRKEARIEASSAGRARAEVDERAAAQKAFAELQLAEALSRTSEILIATVEAQTFNWGLQATVSKSGRQLFGVGGNAPAYFADKQLQLAVASLLPARLSSRHSIVSALARTLENDLPKLVVRLDVQAFYDNIDHGVLLDQLRATDLSPTSLRLIAQLLHQMAEFSGYPKGLPAGVGLSAKLAEFYLAALDVALRDGIGILYYARYVDDIVLVKGETSHPSGDSSSAVVAWVEGEMSKLHLTLNVTKQAIRLLSANKDFAAFEFLGYSISYKAKHLDIRLTSDRIAALKKRIDRTFDAWDRADQSNHGRRRLLLDRLRFLAGNTRLSHNKRDAMVGIYFSNPHVSDAHCFDDLDSYLTNRRAQSSIPSDMTSLIDAISFVNAFQERTVRRFTIHRMVELRGAWRG